MTFNDEVNSHDQRPIVKGQQSMVNGQKSKVKGQRSKVKGQQSAVSSQQSISAVLSLGHFLLLPKPGCFCAGKLFDLIDRLRQARILLSV